MAFFCIYLLMLEREQERERNINFLFHLLIAFTGCILYVPWQEIKHTILVSGGNSNQLSDPARVEMHLMHLTYRTSELSLG